jgi:EVE domain
MPAVSTPKSAHRYFLIAASRDHVLTGVRGGFCQANHGKHAPLKRMSKGDGVVFYSAKEHYIPKGGSRSGSADKCQKFTGIGRVADDEIYQVRVTDKFEPFRRNVHFLGADRDDERGWEEQEEFKGGAREASTSILPLIEKLEFITDKTRWGSNLRFGFLKISEGDWELIRDKMLE